MVSTSIFFKEDQESTAEYEDQVNTDDEYGGYQDSEIGEEEDDDFEQALAELYEIFPKKKAAADAFKEKFSQLRAELKLQSIKEERQEEEMQKKDNLISELFDEIKKLQTDCDDKDVSIGLLIEENQKYSNLRDKLDDRTMHLKTYIERARIHVGTIKNLEFEKASYFIHLVEKKDELKECVRDNHVLGQRVKFLAGINQAYKGHALEEKSQAFSELCDIEKIEKAFFVDEVDEDEERKFLDELKVSASTYLSAKRVQQSLSSEALKEKLTAIAQPIIPNSPAAQKVNFLASAYVNALINGTLDVKPKEATSSNALNENSPGTSTAGSQSSSLTAEIGSADTSSKTLIESIEPAQEVKFIVLDNANAISNGTINSQPTSTVLKEIPTAESNEPMLPVEVTPLIDVNEIIPAASFAKIIEPIHEMETSPTALTTYETSTTNIEDESENVTPLAALKVTTLTSFETSTTNIEDEPENIISEDTARESQAVVKTKIKKNRRGRRRDKKVSYFRCR